MFKNPDVERKQNVLLLIPIPPTPQPYLMSFLLFLFVTKGRVTKLVLVQDLEYYIQLIYFS